VTISFQYQPGDVVSERIGKHVHGQWRSLSEMVAIAVLLVVLYIITRLVLRTWDDYFTALSPNLPVVIAAILWAGITLGMVGAYLVVVFVSQYRDLVGQRDAEASAYSGGPVEVEIGADGIRTRAPGRSQHIGWMAVSGVIETPLGLGLRLDNRDFIPVATEALGDVPLAEAARRIAEWRGKRT
jgi:hypothetical protein